MNQMRSHEPYATQKIMNILKSYGCEVLIFPYFKVFIAIAPFEKIYIIAVTPKCDIEAHIKQILPHLFAIRNGFISTISDTLEEIKMDITPIIVCDCESKISGRMESFLYMNHVLLLTYDGTAESITDNIPEPEPLDDEESKDNFKASVEYIQTVIKYFGVSAQPGVPNYFETQANNSLNICEEEFSSLESDNKDDIQIKNFSSPRELAEEIKKYIIGQDAVINEISIPFYQHYESMINKTTSEIKTSFILAGGTGTAKTEILRRFGQVSGVPIIRINSADFSGGTWKGRNISDHISSYLSKVNDPSILNYAVFIFDEVDKTIHRHNEMISLNGADCDADTQREWLRMFDKGYEIIVDMPGSLDKFRFCFDNTLICFVGAFSGIERIIEKRLNIHQQIGFQATSHLRQDTIAKANIMSHLSQADMEQWGFMPELLSRISSYFVTQPMTEDLIYNVFTKASENIIDAHKKQCAQYGITLSFTEEALREIASETMKLNLGFRPAKKILANVMKDIYFDCDKYENSIITIDKEYIETHV